MANPFYLGKIIKLKLEWSFKNCIYLLVVMFWKIIQIKTHLVVFQSSSMFVVVVVVIITVMFSKLKMSSSAAEVLRFGLNSLLIQFLALILDTQCKMLLVKCWISNQMFMFTLTLYLWWMLWLDTKVSEN